jgi:hypothetical protein
MQAEAEAESVRVSLRWFLAGLHKKRFAEVSCS